MDAKAIDAQFCKDFKKLQNKLTGKQLARYVEQLTSLLQYVTEPLMELRWNGIVLYKDQEFIFYALADIDLKQWRIVSDWSVNVTEQFADRYIVPRNK